MAFLLRAVLFLRDHLCSSCFYIRPAVCPLLKLLRRARCELRPLFLQRCPATLAEILGCARIKHPRGQRAAVVVFRALGRAWCWTRSMRNLRQNVVLKVNRSESGSTGLKWTS